MEHHGSPDGYLPSPIVLAGAIAGVTRRVTINLNVILLPLYHPVKLAEDLAVLDVIAQGRLRVTVAGGYREEEYEQFGIDIEDRPTRMEDGIAVLKRAWTGEPFEWQGRTVHVLPRPLQQPRPSILMGGASMASARRAARMADGYQPVHARYYEAYLDELRALGRPSPPVQSRRGGGGGLCMFISPDPDEAWVRLGPHLLHDTNTYAGVGRQWPHAGDGVPSGPHRRRAPGDQHLRGGDPGRRGRPDQRARWLYLPAARGRARSGDGMGKLAALGIRGPPRTSGG